MPKVAIIDYKMSNMFSIKNAIDLLGFASVITSTHEEILDADCAILPGVGSFPEAMKHIDSLNLRRSIEEFIESGKPFMGICLGMQLLFDSSEEFETTKGLGLIEGEVKSFLREEGIGRVPHVGWNSIKIANGEKLAGVGGSSDLMDYGEHFYFVHSFYVKPDYGCDIYTTTEYAGVEFCSSVLRDNILTCQFHPEKSGVAGLRVLKSFFDLDKG